MGYASFEAKPGTHSQLDGATFMIAATASPLVLQFGGGNTRVELALNLGIVRFFETDTVRPFGTLSTTLLFWP